MGERGKKKMKNSNRIARAIATTALAVACAAFSAAGEGRGEAPCPGRCIKYVAHRGDYPDVPEGSMAAYRNAVARGSEIVKLDVHPSKDGVIVLSHDPSLRRTMGWDVKIVDVSWDEIRRHTYLFNGQPTQEKAVSLPEALETLKPIPEFWIDFKHFDPDFCERVLAEFAKAGISRQRIMVATYTQPALRYMKERHPDIRRIGHMDFMLKDGKWSPSFWRDKGVLYAPAAPGEEFAHEVADGILAYASEMGLWGVNICASPRIVKKGLVAHLKKNGLWVSLALIQTARLARRFVGYENDCVVTRDRRTVKSILDQAASCGEFVLAERGATPPCAIEVLSKEPSAARAAQELSDYVAKMTGVRMPVAESAAATSRIVRLEPGDAGLGNDGFELAVEGNVLHVRGGVRGILYGVYEILERFGGVGWFSSWHEVVPVRDRMAVPDGFRCREIPEFALREPFWSDANSHPEFAAHIRKNNMGFGKIPPELGGCFRRASKRLKGHTFNVIVPPEKHFKEHPEYFSEINGVRRADGTQLCCSNPDVIALITREMREQMRNEPEADIFNLTINDCFNNCQCSGCRAIDEEEGSSSGAYYRMVNAVAEALLGEFPNKLIRPSAYQWTRRPPKKLKRLPKNVLISIAPIECDFSRPIPESPYKANVDTVADIREWGKIAQGSLQIFDYCTSFNHYPQAFPNVKSLKGNLLFYHDNNVRYVINEGAHSGVNGASFAELKAWLEAKLLWDPYQDVAPLLDTFFNGFYGKGAAYTRRYFDELEALPRDPEKQPLLCMDETPYKGFPDDAFLDHAMDLWRKAESAVADDPACLRNVRLGKFSVQYMILRRQCPMIWATPDLAPMMRVRDVAKETVAYVKGERLKLGIAERDRDIRKSETFAAWKRLAETETPPSSDVRGIGEEKVFRLYGKRNGRVSIKADPMASGGKAACIAPKYWTWCMQLSAGEVLAREGERYRVRLRARVEFRPGAKRKGTAFSGGFSTKVDPETRRFTRDVACSEVVDGYAWYDLGSWSPKVPDNGTFWVALGMFDTKASHEHPDVSAVWVDQISFVLESAAGESP